MYQKVAPKTSKGKNLKENGGDAKKAEHGKWRVSSLDITSETSQSETESKPQRSSLRSWLVGGKLKDSRGDACEAKKETPLQQNQADLQTSGACSSQAFPFQQLVSTHLFRRFPRGHMCTLVLSI